MLPDSKKLFLLTSLCFLIVLLLGFNLALSRYGAFWQKPKPSSVIVLPTPTPFLLASPVEDGLLQTIPTSAADSDHLVFFLPPETPIYAVFEGEVSKVVPGTEFDNVQLTRSDGLTASYLIFGRVLVGEGKKVAEGEVIATTKKGEGPGCLSGGNLGLYLFKNGEPLRLTREMLKTAGLEKK
ncbi:MAG: peptidoglycan DD-metalloendopeptidase family protein [Chloroflexi bacterium]|nr:peptidoglycan DD-metalloendopeptidase family protein [Chloroflexota bacterium]